MHTSLRLAPLALLALAACGKPVDRAEGVTGEAGTNMAAVVPGNATASDAGAANGSGTGNVQADQLAKQEANRQRMGVDAPAGTGRVGQGGTSTAAAIPNGSSGAGTNTGIGAQRPTSEGEMVGASGGSGTGTKSSGGSSGGSNGRSGSNQ